MYAEENHQKIIKTRSLLQQQFCYTLTVLPGDIETNPGPVNPDNQQMKPKSDRLPSTCQLGNKTVRINSKKLLCIHCRSLVHFQCSTLKAMLITKTLVNLMNRYVQIAISKNFLSQDYVNFKRFL